jgi:acyl-CoA dehydrogenase
VPAGNLLGEPGAGFAVAQSRLGGGRLHHAIHTVGLVRRTHDMCERAVTRRPQGEELSRKQLVQLHQRWVRGESTDPRMAERAEPVAALAERAIRLLRANSR